MTILWIVLAFVIGMFTGARVNRALMIRQAKDVFAKASPAELYKAVSEAGTARPMTAAEYRDLERERARRVR